MLQAQQAQQAKALRKAQVRGQGRQSRGAGRTGAEFKGCRAVPHFLAGTTRHTVGPAPLTQTMPLPPALLLAQGEQLRAEVVLKMRERQEAAKRKREAAEKSRYRWVGEWVDT